MDQEHPEIPRGLYCYTVVDGKRKACPHWKKTEAGARCELLQVEHVAQCGWHLLWDQCKECGINRGYPPAKRINTEGWEPYTTTCVCGVTMQCFRKGGKK